MRNTTEKSVEVNILRHLANCLEERTHRQITVLSPSQLLEDFVGYDDILHGLPRGWVIAIQFKRPEEFDANHVRFKINIPQLDVLRRLFPPRNAFYFLSPFPTHLEFIQEQPRILQRSYVVDAHLMHHVLTNFLPRAGTRTIRVTKSNGDVLFTGNRKRRITHSPLDVEFFCRQFSGHGIGYPSGRSARRKKFTYPKDDFSQYVEKSEEKYIPSELNDNSFPYSKKLFKKYRHQLRDVFYMHIASNRS